MDLKTQLSPYLYRKLRERIATVPESKEALIKDAINMSRIGINSEEEYKSFLDVLKYSPALANKLAGQKLTLEEISSFANLMYSDRKRFPIDTVPNFYKAAEQALNKMKIPIKKVAYPQGDGSTLDVKSPHDMQKWMAAMKDIYAQGQQSGDLSQAFQNVTAQWDKMEKQDFRHWLSFYEESAHNKYKTAQKYYEAGPGAMIPIEHLKAKLPGPPDMRQFDQADASDALMRQKAENDRRELVKKKIKSIVSRLNAAERLATDPDVQKDLQQCLDIGVPKWLEELQRVKRLVQLAPMRSGASTILEDIIIKQANILEAKGYPKAAKEMSKLAQTPPPGLDAPPGMDATPGGAPPGLGMPGMPGGDTGEGDKALDELVENMNIDSNESQDDINAIEDVPEEEDPLASITVIAQAVTEPTAIPEKSTTEVTEPEAARTIVDPRTDDLFEAALSNVSMKDIITRLETLANIFRTREIPRQLAIIDLMMDKLNISAFFPSLAEASSKSLESNQYALTRIEDILSKLRGSIETPKSQELDLVGNNPKPTTPIPEGANVENVKQNLMQQDAAEKARKERRQAEEDAKASQLTQPAPAETPVSTEELAQPTNIVPPTR